MLMLLPAGWITACDADVLRAGFKTAVAKVERDVMQMDGNAGNADPQHLVPCLMVVIKLLESEKALASIAEAKLLPEPM